jgi:hypothetical protein
MGAKCEYFDEHFDLFEIIIQNYVMDLRCDHVEDTVLRGMNHRFWAAFSALCNIKIPKCKSNKLISNGLKTQ